MASYTWRDPRSGGGGAFDVASNWQNQGEPVSSTVPTSADTAVLQSGGGPISGAGSVDTLAFSNAAWSVTGQITAATVTLDGGTLTAATSGGQVVATNTMQIGLNSSAALAATNGGTVAVAGSSGSISQFGSATLTVSNLGVASFGTGLAFGVGGRSATGLVNAAVLAVGGQFQLGAGGSGSLSVIGGGQAVLSAAIDTSTPYLKVGAADGSLGSVAIDGANSLLLLANNSGAVGYRGTGTLTVTGGGAARFNASANSSNNALNPALTIGRYGNGAVTVSGSGSLVAAGGSIIVGTYGQGTLTIQNGAAVTSMGFLANQAALAVASGAGGGGGVTVTGPGSSLTASGEVIVGGDDRGSGLVAGNAGSIQVVNGGALQSGVMTILAGSNVSVGGGSVASISGDLATSGLLTSTGTLAVSGALYGGGAVQVGAGVASFGSLGSAGSPAATLALTASGAQVRLGGVVGANVISAFQVDDTLDFVGNSSVRLFDNVITTTTGTIALSAPPSGQHYYLTDDAAGGALLILTPNTIGVYRFFDSNYGTHFFSGSGNEKDTVLSTRPDLVYEGVGLQAIDPASADPNAADVYRFFDTQYGTHFFTASATERNTIRSTRADLIYEGAGFQEHTTQQAGDIPVYRFFDSKFGTHFYTADANERATVVATRPDLVEEAGGFFAPTR